MTCSILSVLRVSTFAQFSPCILLVPQELQNTAAIILHPHLDDDEWQAWKIDLMKLHETLQATLTQMEKDAESKATRMRASVQDTLRLCPQSTLIKAVDLRDGTKAVSTKYIELDQALNAYQPYHPVSLTYFEPTSLTERFNWLQKLQLSHPTALLKVPVGGNLGTLAWVVKRDPTLMEHEGDELELGEARDLLRPMIPQVKAQAIHSYSTRLGK